MDYKEILIATDGSTPGTHAVIKGLALARQLGAGVTAVTVSELWSPIEMAARSQNGEANPVKAAQEAAAGDAKRILDGVAQLASQMGIACRLIHIADQRPAEGIVQAAREQACDLVLVGTHGRRGVDRLLLGSQAAEVIALSIVPVVVCK